MPGRPSICLRPSELRWASRARPWRSAALVAALLASLAFLPVRQSVLAQAEVVAHAPTLVRAPIEGVVDKVHVQPNEPVTAGQPLLSLDATELRTRLAVAQKARDITNAEYLQTAQQAVYDAEAKARLILLEGRVEQQSAEVAYVQSLLERIHVTAAQSGVTIFDDVNDWIGRPVAVGERIMLLADSALVELEIRLPVADAASVVEDATVDFFLNIAPDEPVPATVTFASYRAAATPDGQLAYRLKARLDAGNPDLRIGLKGTAKIYGGVGPFLVWALRRPLATIRQWVGR
jgi:multidrug efflux pump subunit AcrA (membrane-fusion protein)